MTVCARRPAPTRRRVALLLLLAAAAAGSAPVAALAAPTGGSSATNGVPASDRSTIEASANLWATIDACSPADQTDVIGVRASMPVVGAPGVVMYMRFSLEYEGATATKWVPVFGATSLPPFVDVGAETSGVVQSGSSFTVQPAPTATLLRGVVDFQWRRGTTVLLSARLDTSSGHPTTVDSDPRGFSAATCTIPATMPLVPVTVAG